MSLIHNERTKLTATYFNGAAISIFAIGGFAPVAAGFGSGLQTITISSSLTSVVCVSTSIILHLLARRVLKGLIA
ncbi:MULTISPECIES: amino acid transporter [unclassified Rhizobium]|uniref:amino acid transporter n=1 Tax=unclassified Rhizobium TaxID=2613769 RepID=UPI000AB972F7|nr:MULTISPECIES: amino acid transporter [unclassified Rhizobium]